MTASVSWDSAPAGRAHITKRRETRLWELLSLFGDYAYGECVIYLRTRTRGRVDNTHPLHLTEELYVVHNGTLDIACRPLGRYDTWHLLQEYLRPALVGHTDLIYNPLFLDELKRRIGPENRLVLMDGRRQRTVIVNKESGTELKGLWLSNIRWFDASRFGLGPPPMPPVRLRLRGLAFA
ncbi:MAG: hypothetical protein ACT4NU_09105 [Chromatiales bacterium]